MSIALLPRYPVGIVAYTGYHCLPTLIDACALHNLRMDNILDAPVLLCAIHVKIHEAEICCGAREYVFALSTLARFLSLSLSVVGAHIHIGILIEVCMCVCACLCLSNTKRENVFMSFSVLLLLKPPYNIVHIHFIVFHCVEAMTPPTIHISFAHTYTHTFCIDRATSECLCVDPGRMSFSHSKHSNSLLWTFNSCAECFCCGAPSNKKKQTFIIDSWNYFRRNVLSLLTDFRLRLLSANKKTQVRAFDLFFFSNYFCEQSRTFRCVLQKIK